MPAAARIKIDKIITGHLCSMIAGISGPGATGPTGRVFVNGSLAACAGDVIAPHTIRSGRKCVPHGAIINTGSTRVNAAGRPMAKIGDSADRGIIISGSFKVFIGA